MFFLAEAEGIDHKHELPAVVYRWGGGVLSPTTLPLPGKTDVEVVQVAIGRTNKTGVTSKGRLINWDVSLINLCSINTLLGISILCSNDSRFQAQLCTCTS